MNLKSYTSDLKNVIDTVLEHESVLDAAADTLIACLQAGGTLLTCGNGGSASQAQHLVTELMGRYRSNRKSLRAIFLGGDASLLSCVANDFDWEESFARPLSGLARPNDFLISFTTSGNSRNVVRTLERAKELELASLTLMGKDGGSCKGLATWEVIVPSDSTARIQEAHLFMLHYLCEKIEVAFS